MNLDEIAKWTPKQFTANRSFCERILEEKEVFEVIPSLNEAPLHDFRDEQLVRFRGMLQDMFNPEFYVEPFDQKDSGTMESTRKEYKQRQSCFVISTPALNEWAQEKRENSIVKSRIPSNSSGKRTLDEAEKMDCSQPGCKKSTENNPNSGICQRADSGSQSMNSEQSLLSRDHIMNFPVPNENGKACIVKIYNEVSYKLNQVLDIVGFISLDPLLSTLSSDETMDDPETQTHNPPVSLVPRLHAIKVVEFTKNDIPRAPEIISRAVCVRSDLRMLLSQVLFGDETAADYLICHLISSIYMRRECLTLGSLPLNITHFPIKKYATFPKDLYDIIALLVPKSHYLELTLDNLNDLNIIPKKDYECNRLMSGVLQLSSNTHLVIDETKLTSGRVTENGTKNYAAIGELVKYQKVTYDFKFYTMDFETDLPILILSETKSMIPCDTRVALKIDPENEQLYPEVLEAARRYCNEEKLKAFREYLEVLRHAEFEFNDEITDVIQEDFVRIRQSDDSMGADDLHSMLVLARLMSLSHGVKNLTVEHWKKTVQMETERKARFQRRA